MKKRSECVYAFGTSFEVPPLTRWLTVDFRGYVFASSEQKRPEVINSAGVELWNHHGVGFYVGKMEIGGEDWKALIHDVAGERYRLSKLTASEVTAAFEYCSSVLRKVDSEDSHYFAKMVSVISDRLTSKIK